MNIKVKKLWDSAKLPTYATDGSGCFDLYWSPDYKLVPAFDGIIAQVLLEPTSPVFSTGLCFAIPEGHVMLIFSRSNHGFLNNVRLANCVGVIDSDYRGEVKIKLRNDDPKNFFFVTIGDRIAQAMVIPIDKVQFEQVEELDTTTRGEGGFGSTGR